VDAYHDGREPKWRPGCRIRVLEGRLAALHVLSDRIGIVDDGIAALRRAPELQPCKCLQQVERLAGGSNFR
jgi:hypothetical protein